MPDMSGRAGAFTPLWTDEVVPEGSAIYDPSLDVYLVTCISGGGIHVRASRELIHWTGTVGVIPYPTAPATTYFCPNLLGETGDPTIGDRSPRVYFSAFPANVFPKHKLSTFEYVPVPPVCCKAASPTSLRASSLRIRACASRSTRPIAASTSSTRASTSPSGYASHH
jgi:hypothetical protein